MLRRFLIIPIAVLASTLVVTGAPAGSVASKTPTPEVTASLGEVVEEFPAVDTAVDQALRQPEFDAAADAAPSVVQGSSVYSVPPRPTAIKVPGTATGSTEFHFGSDVVRFMLEGQDDTAEESITGVTSSREDVFPGVDSHHVTWSGGVEEFLHVSNGADANSHRFTWLVDLPDGWSLVAIGDAIEVLDDSQSSVIQFRAPWAQASTQGTLGRPEVQLESERSAIRVEVPNSVASGEYVLDPVWLLSGAVGNYRWRSCGDNSAAICDHNSTTVPAGWQASTSSGDSALFAESFTADRSAVLETAPDEAIPSGAYAQWTYTPPTGVQVKQVSWLGTQTLSESGSPMRCQVGWAEDGSTFTWSSGSTGSGPSYEESALGTYPSPDDLWLAVALRLVNTGSSFTPALTTATDICETATQDNHLTLLLFDRPTQAPEVIVELDDADHDGIVGPAQPSVDVEIDVTDVGSGVRRIEQSIDGVGYSYVGSDCVDEELGATDGTDAGLADTSPCDLVVNVPSAPQALGGLSDGMHAIHARAEDFAGNVSAADTAAFEWDSVAPAAPSSVQLTGADVRSWLDDVYLGVGDEVSASWSSATDANLTVHEARLVPSAESCTTVSGVTDWEAVSPTNGTIDTLALVNGSEYTWCVRGLDAAGNVGASATVSFVVDTDDPTDVSGLSSPVSIDPVKLHAAWTTASVDVSPVQYETCGSSIGIDSGAPVCDLGTWYEFGPSAMSATAIIDAGVEESDTVYTCVRVRDLFDRISDGVCVESVLDFTAPPRPADVIDGASGPDVDLIDPIEPLSGDDRLDARWTASVGADSYLSCFTQLSSCHPSAPVAPVPGSLDESVTIWSIVDTFMPGTLIRFCISARDAAGNVSPAACSDGAVIDGFPPKVVRVDDGAAADIARQTATSTYAGHWTSEFEFAAIDEYQWSLCAVPCVTPVDSGATSSTSVSLTGLSLSLGTTYRLCVVAVDVHGRESDSVCSNGTNVFAYDADVAEVQDGDFGYDQSVIAEGGTLKAKWYRSPSTSPDAIADWEVCSAAPCGEFGSTSESTGTNTTGSISAAVTVSKGVLYYVCVELPGGATTCSDGALGAEAGGGSTGSTDVVEVPVTAREPSSTFDVDEIKFGDSYTAGWTTVADYYSTFWRLCEDSSCTTEVQRGVLDPLQTSISFERPAISTTWYTCIVIVDNTTGDAVIPESCSDGATVVGSSVGTTIATGLTPTNALIGHDTVWRKANSPYIVLDNLVLGEGNPPLSGPATLRPATLTIEPGVVVKFAAEASIRVASGSNLITNGTKKSPVVFTSIHDDAADEVDSDLDVVAPASDDWSELRLDEGAYGTLNGLVIKYSGSMTTYADDLTWRNGAYVHGGQTLVEGYRTRFENMNFAENTGPVHVNAGASIVMRDSVVDGGSAAAGGLYLSVYEEAAFGDPASPRSVFIGNTFRSDSGTTFSVTYASGFGPVFTNGPLIRGNNLRMPGDGNVVTGSNFAQVEPTWSHNYWGKAPEYGSCSIDGDPVESTILPTVLSDFGEAHDAAVMAEDWQYCPRGTPWFYPVDGIVTHPAHAAPIGGGVVDDARLGTDEDLQPTTDLDATDPVNTFIGNFHHTRVDFEIQVPGENPTISRTYNSLDIMPGVFGDGWSSVLDTSLEVAGDRATFRSESGQRVEFARKKVDGSWSQLGAAWTRLTGDAEDGYELRVRDGRTYRFDGLGRLAERLDRHGNGFRVEREADPEEDLTIVDTAGGTVDVDIDAGRVQRLDSSDGRVVVYGFGETPAKSVVQVTDEYGGVWRYGYDKVGRMSCEKNPNGHLVFENEYAPHGEVERQWDGARGGCAALGESVDSVTPTLFEFDRTDPQAQVTTVTDPAGGEWIHSYDAVGAVTSSTDPTDRCTSFVYDAAGNLVTEIRPNGLKLVRTHDDRGRVLSTQYARSTSSDGASWNCPGSVPEPTSDELDEPFTETVTYDDDTSNVFTFERQYEGAVDLVDVQVNTYDSNENLERIELVGESGTTTPCEADIDRCVDLEYDSHGQLVEHVDARGKVSTFAWDIRGHQVRSTPAGRGATRTFYDERGRPVRITRATDGFVTGLGTSTWFRYDDGSDHRLDAVIDPNGATTAYEHDAAGNVTTIVDAEDRRWEFEFNDFEELASESGPGLTREYEYDERGLLVATVDGGERTEYEHDAAGRPDRVIPPRGTAPGATPADFDWVTTYGAAGHPLIVDGPEGSRMTLEYDLLGRRTIERREHEPSTTVIGNVTREFDDQGRVVATARREGAATTGGLVAEVTLNEFGDLVSRVDERGKTWSFITDGAGNRIREISPEGRIRGWEYDDAGAVVATVGPRGFEDPLASGSSVADPLDPDVTTYDANRVSIARNAATGDVMSVTEPGGVETTYKYTLAGQVASVTNGEGEMTSYHYDWVGRPTGVSSPDGSRSHVDYRDSDNEVVMRSPMGRETVYAYDNLGRVRSKELPSGRTWKYEYLPGGLLAKVTLPDGTGTICIVGDGAIDHEYDDLGRRVSTDYSDVSSDDVSWSYDDENATATMTDGLGSELRSFDGFGRLVETARSGHSTISYGWLGEDLLDVQQVIGADPVNYSYDDDGLVTSFTTDSRSTSYARDLGGNIETVTHPDGGPSVDPATEIREFDPMGRVTSLESTAALLDLDVTYDLAGRVTEVDRNGGPGEFDRYEYDDNGRLSQECYGEPCGEETGYWTSHEYDRNGNRTKSEGDGDEYVFRYDIDDRLTRTKIDAAPATVLEYDVRGQLSDDGKFSYWYNQGGSMTGLADSGDPTPAITFDISGDERRLGQTVNADSKRLVWSDAIRVPQVAAEFDHSSGTLERQHVFGDLGISMIEIGGDWYDYQHSPVVGSVERMTDDEGAISSAYFYSGFGELNDWVEIGASQPYRFAGERLTPTTDESPTFGNYHLRAREYDPSLGVFTSPDPVERSMSAPFNGTYNYAEGVPTFYVDPMGTFGVPFMDTGYELEFNPMDGVNSIVNIGRGATGGATDVIADSLVDGASSTVEQHTGQQLIGGAATLIAGGAGSRLITGVGVGGGVVTVGASAGDCYFGGPKPRHDAQRVNRQQACINTAIGAGLMAVPGVRTIRNSRRVDDAPPASAQPPSSCTFSFAGETLVLMGDKSWKPIRDVRVGDIVWATDPVADTAGPRKVLQTLPHVEPGKFVRIHAAGGSIVATERHPIWNDTTAKWQRAGTLGSAARLLDAEGVRHDVATAPSGPTPGRLVYDLTIETTHTFHVKVGNAAVLVHNCGGPVGRQGKGGPIEIAPGTNSPANIGGRDFSGHAIDRMQGRGIPPSAVGDAIEHGTKKIGDDGEWIFNNGQVSAVVDPATGRVITVW